uniref:Uncharacterized protein n=1 Tax=Arundo donax TaxID=35708 RepID=A0A0A9F9D5_ARUDO
MWEGSEEIPLGT